MRYLPIFPPQQTLNGTFSCISVRHSTHFFIIDAQLSHATIWLQGRNKTDAVFSEHTKQSSIYNKRIFTRKAKLFFNLPNMKIYPSYILDIIHFYLFAVVNIFFAEKTFFHSNRALMTNGDMAARKKQNISSLVRAHHTLFQAFIIGLVNRHSISSDQILHLIAEINE